ncbi:MAG: hypothetical protein QOH88_3177 [Verrucomicrobiota bacterium]
MHSLQARKLSSRTNFQQIQKGKKLIPAPGQKPPWIYGGAPIAIDPAGVYNVPTNPNRKNYSPAQLNLCDTFNYTYTNLLKTLHNMFNGHRDQCSIQPSAS